MKATQETYERNALQDYSDQISEEEARDEWIECRIAEITNKINAALKSGEQIDSRMSGCSQTALDELAEYSSDTDHWIKQAILGKSITGLLIDSYARHYAEHDYLEFNAQEPS
jgi:hypothetical protein